LVQSAVRHVTIDEQVGQRIDNFLFAQFRKLPRARVYRMVRSGEVRVNGRRVKFHYRLSEGDKVRLPPVANVVAPQVAQVPAGLIARLTDAVLYEDRDLLVLDKPSGLAVHGGSGLSFGLIEALRSSHGPHLELIHRLDRETSGVLLIAKNRKTLRRWQEQMRPRVAATGRATNGAGRPGAVADVPLGDTRGRTSKQYLVLVQGVWPVRVRSVRRALTKFTTASGERRVRCDPQGKAARTDFQVLAAGTEYSLVQASLHTGRTHQIRVHCQSVDRPVLGDTKYGSAAADAVAKRLGVGRLCLHASRLKADLDGLSRRFSAPVPIDLQQLIDAL